MNWKISFVFNLILTFSQSHFVYHYPQPQPVVEPVLLPVYDLRVFQTYAHPHIPIYPYPQLQKQPNVPVINFQDDNNFRPPPKPDVNLRDVINDARERPSSNHLCPHEVQLYHNETRRCYYPSEIASQKDANVSNESPCGPLQHFERVSDGYGDCVCVHDENGCSLGLTGILKRPVLNWSGTNKCYYAYDQGPCNSGEWLVTNPTTRQPECKPNPCLGREPEKLVEGTQITPKDDLEVFWFQKDNDNTCYQTFTQAYCDPGQFVIFPGTNRHPDCFHTNAFTTCGGFGSAQPSTQMDCAEGLKKLPDGDCVASVDIE